MKNKGLENNKRGKILKKLLVIVCKLICLSIVLIVGYFAFFVYAVGQVGWR
ncbi:hypothetical protein [Aliivibrio fischeri]|uniref:hypothetical protein n=1 Tax=Aliivibrio fischeri TaxID=668 RepID=UPI00159F317F|nr:hypothetical protein [Aliivibrio fischeri]